MQRFHLYIDDSGSRRPDHSEGPRKDGMDCFALGGYLIAEADVPTLVGAHAKFMKAWDLTGPLHSTRIRGRRDQFTWLGTDKEREAQFLGELEEMVLGLPVLGMACVIDRPGYVERYNNVYQTPWLLCKTAYAILIERSLRYVIQQNGWLQVFFEGAGKQEDRDLYQYARALQTEGMPFQGPNAAAYGGLQPEAFKERIVGQPNRITKNAGTAQIADLMLYPIAKGGYDPDYRPYRALMASKRIIDAILDGPEIAFQGCKYSCFDFKKQG